MSEDYAKKFISAIIAGTRICGALKDRFFADRLEDALADLVRMHADPIHAGSERLLRIRHRIHDISGIIDICEHLRIAEAILLLKGRRAFLDLASAVTKEAKTAGVATPLPAKSAETVPLASSRVRIPHHAIPAVPLKENQQKILEFISEFPDARTKDIVESFGVLSERTVKRNLRDLISSGLVTKRADKGAVHYSPAPRR